MASWNLAHVRRNEYTLLNGAETPIRCSPTSNPDIVALMSQMEELGVPPAYADNLDEIYFTRSLPGRDGDYFAGRIRLVASHGLLARTLVHELAHHVDDMIDVTADEFLTEERRNSGKYMADRYCRKDDGEYLAVGFEVFYFGDREEKAEMREKNPLLFRTVQQLHRRFQRR